jgi:hypothetical protein
MRLPPLAWLVLIAGCNSPPELLAVTLRPEAPSTTDDLVLTIDSTDANSHEVELDIRWTTDGAAVADLDGKARVPASMTRKGQSWSVEVTGTDGVLTSKTVSAAVTVVNSAPTATSVSVEPAAPTAVDAIHCIPQGFDDPDQDPEDWRLSWMIDGSAISATGPTLAAGTVAAGRVVTCTAVPFDGELEGEGVSGEVTVHNTPPRLYGVTLSPEAPTTLTDLVAVPGTTADVDGDEVSVDYAWRVDGNPVGSNTATLPASFFAKGDVVEVTATSRDPSGAGEASTAAVTIGNAAPILSDVVLSPAEATTLDALRLSWTVDDPDGDSTIELVVWTIDGVEVGRGASLPAGVAHRGDLVVAELVTSDGTASDAAAPSLTVGNAVPTAPVLAMDPSPEAEAGTDDLRCTIAAESVDPDGDDISYTFAWSVDGAPFTGSTLSSTHPGDMIDRDDLSGGETWTCTATADDGTDTSAPVAVDVEIVTCTTTTHTIYASDSGSVSYGSVKTVWADNRVRAETDGSSLDVVGWLLFDLSAIDPSAEVTSATIELHEEWGSVGGVPKLVFVESVSTGWSRSSLTATSVVKNGAVSAEYTSFTLGGWNTFSLDVSAWDWETALTNGEATLGADNVGWGTTFVYFHGPDTSGKVPQLDLETEVCE